MDPLSQLHDIQLPAPIGWWPLAYGWCLLMLLLVLLAVFLFYRIKKYKKRRAYAEVFSILDDADFAGVSTLLRRIALLKYPRENVAGLQGEAWLAFLNKTGNTNGFTQGAGRILVTAPYEPHQAKADKELVSLVSSWIKSQGLG